MNRFKLSMAAIGAATAVIGTGAAAQDAQPVFAGVQNDSALVVIIDGEPTVIDSGAVDYSQITVSPDGRWVAWRELETYQSQSMLNVYDRETGFTQMLTQNVDTGLPASFTADGTALVYATYDPAAPMDGQDSIVQVVIQPIGAENPPITVEIPVAFGCGGGSLYPSDWRYWAETNSFGGNAPILESAPQGIIYTRNCSGIGITIYDAPTGRSVDFPDLTRASYNAKTNTLLAAVIDNEFMLSTRLALIDLETMNRRDIDIGATPDQIALTDDGAGAWVSVQAFDGYIALTDEQITGLTSGMGIEADPPPQIPQYVSSLLYIDLATGAASVTGVDLPVYSIARIQPVGGTVYFSAVDNLNGWVQAVGDGSLNLAQASFEAQEASTGVTTYAFDTASGAFEAIAGDLAQPTVIGG
jgi:hypothetical protein